MIAISNDLFYQFIAAYLLMGGRKGWINEAKKCIVLQQSQSLINAQDIRSLFPQTIASSSLCFILAFFSSCSYF
jgi:hypothetical protein